jgi:membrane fusion protein (multidrug efflux system)
MKIPLMILLAGLTLATIAPAAEAPAVRALLAARQHTILSSQLAGRLARLEVKAGDAIRKGQVVAGLDCALQRAQLAEHRADLTGAEKIQAVNRQLAGLNAGSALDAATAEANLGKARARVEMAETSLSMCDIRAPFDGHVVERRAEPFQNVAAGQAVLDIQDDGHLDVEMIIPSGWVAWLKPGSPFTLSVDETGRTYPGRIARLGVRIDAASQSLKVIGDLTGPAAELLPGMSGEARFGKP